MVFSKVLTPLLQMDPTNNVYSLLLLVLWISFDVIWAVVPNVIRRKLLTWYDCDSVRIFVDCRHRKTRWFRGSLFSVV